MSPSAVSHWHLMSREHACLCIRRVSRMGQCAVSRTTQMTVIALRCCKAKCSSQQKHTRFRCLFLIHDAISWFVCREHFPPFLGTSSCRLVLKYAWPRRVITCSRNLIPSRNVEEHPTCGGVLVGLCNLAKAQPPMVRTSTHHAVGILPQHSVLRVQV